MNKLLLIGIDAEKLRIKKGKYQIIYSYMDNINHPGPGFNGNVKVIPDDFFMAIDYIVANNRACIDIDVVYEQIIDNKKLSPLINIGGDEYAELLTKKAVLQEMEKIYRYFGYAKKIIDHFHITDKLDFIPGKFSYTVYRKLLTNGLLPDNIDIHKTHLLKMKLEENIKNAANAVRLLIYPESMLLKMKGKRKFNAEPGDYKYGVYIHGGRGFSDREGGMDFFIDGKQIKSDEVLFVADEKPVPKINIDEAKSKGYNVVNFHQDLIEEYAPSQYLKKYYSWTSSLRIKLAALCFKLPFLSAHCFHVLKDSLLWELFYNKYHVEKFISMQHPGSLTRVFSGRQHGVKSIFVHSSVVFDRIDRRDEPAKNKAEHVYYSHLVFDKVVSDKLSNQWLKTSQNSINEYINIGSIFSDIVYNIKSFRKEEIRNRLGVTASGNILSFFDGTVGHHGVLNFEEELILAKSMMRLLEEYEDYTIFFKFKKSARVKQFSRENELIDIFNELSTHPRWFCANDFDVNAFELMGISDLVVSTPLSSVVFESVIGGIRTVYYDPAGRYSQEHYIIEGIPNFTAHSYEELVRRIQYWLHECGENEFAEFQNKYIKQYTADDCDGNAIKRFREVLLTA